MEKAHAQVHRAQTSTKALASALDSSKTDACSAWGSCVDPIVDDTARAIGTSKEASIIASTVDRASKQFQEGMLKEIDGLKVAITAFQKALPLELNNARQEYRTAQQNFAYVEKEDQGVITPGLSMMVGRLEDIAAMLNKMKDSLRELQGAIKASTQDDVVAKELAKQMASWYQQQLEGLTATVNALPTLVAQLQKDLGVDAMVSKVQSAGGFDADILEAAGVNSLNGLLKDAYATVAPSKELRAKLDAFQKDVIAKLDAMDAQLTTMQTRVTEAVTQSNALPSRLNRLNDGIRQASPAFPDTGVATAQLTAQPLWTDSRPHVAKVIADKVTVDATTRLGKAEVAWGAMNGTQMAQQANAIQARETNTVAPSTSAERNRRPWRVENGKLILDSRVANTFCIDNLCMDKAMLKKFAAGNPTRTFPASTMPIYMDTRTLWTDPQDGIKYHMGYWNADGSYYVTLGPNGNYPVYNAPFSSDSGPFYDGQIKATNNQYVWTKNALTIMMSLQSMRQVKMESVRVVLSQHDGVDGQQYTATLLFPNTNPRFSKSFTLYGAYEIAVTLSYPAPLPTSQPTAPGWLTCWLGIQGNVDVSEVTWYGKRF